MPTNEFLSYASDGTPNVMSQSDYAASGARTAGVVAGTADPTLANKAWRQAANMASIIGAFMVSEGYDALDDGDLATLEANFVAALQTLIAAGGTPFATLAEVLAGTVTGKAVDPAKLAAAVNSNTFVFAAAGGTANALTATLTPAPAALVAGMSVWVKATTTNTGAATLNLNGLGAKTIVRAGGSAVSGGDLAAGAIVEMVYDGTNFQAVDLQSAFAPPSSSVVYASSGSYTWTVPAGIYKIKRIRAWGAGGGGGGSLGAGAAGAGGGGGGYAESINLSVAPGQSVAIAIGAGGTAGTGSPSAGGAGGSTTVGSFISITGGSGGGAGNAALSSSGGTGGVASGANLINLTGVTGTPAFTSGGPTGGVGGPGAFGGSSAAWIPSASGSGGLFPGGGGNGGAAGYNGGAGALGLVIIEY